MAKAGDASGGQVPERYPADLEVDIRLGDGRAVHIRPVVPSDGPQLAAAIASADSETLRLRFLGWRPVLDDTTLRHLVEVDYQWRLALVAFDVLNHGVGIARYEGQPGNDWAEIAVAVDPGWRQVGLGSYLLRMLGEAAVARGIRQLVALYFVGNSDVESLVRASGLPFQSQVSRGFVEARLTLPSPGPSELPGVDVQPPA